jgi:hypothetical protein
MSKDENFDDILRSKFNIEQPVEEDNWQNARKLIDTMRKRKRRRIAYIILSAALFCGLGGYEALLLYNTKSETSVNSVVKEQPSPVNNAVPPVKTESVNVENDKPVVANESSEVKEQPANANVIPEKNNVKESPKPNPVAVNSNNAPTVPKQPGVVNPVVAVNYSKNVKKENPPHIENNTMADNNRDKQKQSNLVPVNNAVPPVKPTVVNAEPVKETSKPVKNDDEDKEPEVNKLAVNAAPIKEQNKTESASKANNDITAMAISMLYLPVKDNVCKVTDTISIVASILPNKAPIFVRPVPKYLISVEAGGGYSLGWKYHDTAQGNGVNPIIGIGFTKPINEKWSVKTGVQFSMFSNMNSVPFIIKHVAYDFNYHSNDTAVTTQKLYYVTLPLQVEYKVGQKNAVGMGGTLSYLINATGTVKVYSVNGNTVTNINAYSQNIGLKYNPWNASLYLLYKRNITNKFSVYLIPYFGLMDIKSNSFFGENNFERDSGMKLLLSYNIL